MKLDGDYLTVFDVFIRILNLLYKLLNLFVLSGKQTNYIASIVHRQVLCVRTLHNCEPNDDNLICRSIYLLQFNT